MLSLQWLQPMDSWAAYVLLAPLQVPPLDAATGPELTGTIDYLLMLVLAMAGGGQANN